MSINFPGSQRAGLALPLFQRETEAASAPRVALVCDFQEEDWPSMDVVGRMLFDHLQSASLGLRPERLCPVMPRCWERLPLPAGRHALRNADRLIGRFLEYPRWLRRRASEFDLFHIVDHSYSQLVHVLPPERTVITCHDLDTFRCLLQPEAEPRPRWFRAMAARILDGFRRAAHVLAVSAATRQEILRHGLMPPERVTVVHNGVHPACSPSPDPAADAELARLLPATPAADGWLLSIGSTIPRKRIDVLLRVFAAVCRALPRVRLLRVGGFAPPQRLLLQELGAGDAVTELPRLSPPLLAAVYRKSDLLLQPSESEGFGLPVVEAMSCGCPVVCSDLPVLREVGGDAPVYCPVADIGEWTEAVVRLLQEKLQNPAGYAARRQRAIARASHFSWEETARQTVRVYAEVYRRAHASCLKAEPIVS